MELTKNMFDLLLKLEGGYTNDTRDSGGKTIYGITENYDHDDFKRLAKAYFDKDYDKAKAIAKEVYIKDYWLPNKCDKIDNAKIAYMVFDTAVNCGAHTAGHIFQESINQVGYHDLLVDGIIGEKTLKAYANLPKGVVPDILLNAICSNRVKYYKTRRLFVAFGNGWINRVNRIREEYKGD